MITRMVTMTTTRIIKKTILQPKPPKPEPVLSPEEHSIRERARLREEMLTGANLSMHAAFEAKKPERFIRELRVAQDGEEHPQEGYENTPAPRPNRPVVSSHLSAADRQLLSDAAAAAGLRTASTPAIRRQAKPFKFEGPLEGGAKLPMAFIDHMLQRNARCALEQRNPKKEGTKSRVLYESYKAACTIGEIVELGGRKADIQFDLQRGYVTLLDDDMREIKSRYMENMGKASASAVKERPKAAADGAGPHGGSLVPSAASLVDTTKKFV